MWEKQESSQPVSQSVLTSRNELKKKVGGCGKQGGKNADGGIIFLFVSHLIAIIGRCLRV